MTVIEHIINSEANFLTPLCVLIILCVVSLIALMGLWAAGIIRCRAILGIIIGLGALVMTGITLQHSVAAVLLEREQLRRSEQRATIKAPTEIESERLGVPALE